MNQQEAKKLFGIVNENEKVYYAQIPRCVILDKGIPPISFRLYCYLMARCTKSSVTWISQKAMTADLDMHRNLIGVHLKKLVAHKLIEIKSVGTGIIKHNVYHILDIQKRYGHEAKKPWIKRDFTKPRALPDGHDRALPDGHDRALPDGHKVEEDELTEIEGEELVATGSSTLPGTNVPSVIISPSAISLDSLPARISQKWLDDCLRRYKRDKLPPTWTVPAALKALEDEINWIRSNRVDLKRFGWDEMEKVLDFIDRDDYLSMNIKSPFKLNRYWKNGRVMEVVLDTFINSRENKTMNLAKKMADNLMKYNPEDFSIEGMIAGANK